VDDHSTRLRALEDAVIEHRMRLENGVQVFKDMDDRIKGIEPKPVSPLKIVSITLTIVGMGVATLLWLTDNFGERPTRAESMQLIESHQKMGHEDTKQDIRVIQQQQSEQRLLMQQFQERQRAQDDKLDELLNRVPERRR
jgi:hypothetical protein